MPDAITPPVLLIRLIGFILETVHMRKACIQEPPRKCWHQRCLWFLNTCIYSMRCSRWETNLNMKLLIFIHIVCIYRLVCSLYISMHLPQVIMILISPVRSGRPVLFRHQVHERKGFLLLNILGSGFSSQGCSLCYVNHEIWYNF